MLAARNYARIALDERRVKAMDRTEAEKHRVLIVSIRRTLQLVSSNNCQRYTKCSGWLWNDEGEGESIQATGQGSQKTGITAHAELQCDCATNASFVPS